MLVLLLWLAPRRLPAAASLGSDLLTPQPTPTVASHWQPLAAIQGQGNRDLASEGWQVTVPGPWRIRAVPADKDVLVRVVDRQTGDLFARVWAAGTSHGDLATMPQGRGTYSLQIEAAGAYTLYVEAWLAPRP